MEEDPQNFRACKGPNPNSWLVPNKEGGPTKPTAYLNNIMKADDVGMVSPAQDGNLGPQALLQFFIQPLSDDLLDGQVKIELLLVIGLPHHGEGTRPDLLRRHIIPDHPWPRHDHPTPYSLPLVLVLFLFFLFSVSRLLFPSCHLPFSDSITYRVFFFPGVCFSFPISRPGLLACAAAAATVHGADDALFVHYYGGAVVCMLASIGRHDRERQGAFSVSAFSCFLSPHAAHKGKPPDPWPPSHPTTLCPFFRLSVLCGSTSRFLRSAGSGYFAAP